MQRNTKARQHRPRGFWGTGRKVVANLRIRTRRKHCFLITIETMRTRAKRDKPNPSFPGRTPLGFCFLHGSLSLLRRSGEFEVSDAGG